MELKENGWCLKDGGALVIPVFHFEYYKELVSKVTIEARSKVGIIGVEHTAGKVTVENVVRPTIKLYYNAKTNATATVDGLTAANGWVEATAEHATINSLTKDSLKFTPLVKGSFVYYIEVIASDIKDTDPVKKAVSEVISVTQTVQEQKLVNVKFRNFVKNNWLSLVFLGIAFLCIIGIIVLAFYKPTDADEIAAKKAAKKAKVEDAEEEAPAVEAADVEEAEEAEEAVEEVTEEVEATEEATEEVVETVEEATEAPATEEAPVEDAPATETPVEDAPAAEENA